MANIPTVSWDETNPADSQARSLGDDRLRELKTQIREVMAVDHQFVSSGQGTTWGYHNKITLKTQASAPTAVADCIILYAKDVSAKAELHFIDEDSNSQQLTSGGDWSGGMANEIRMWSGTIATIPPGWALCDGLSGRPDLLAKFVRGINTSATEPGTTGGTNTKTLGQSSVASHDHSVASSGTHTHDIKTFVAPVMSYYPFVDYDSAYSIIWTSGIIGNNTGAHTHIVDWVDSDVGFDNQPAYYELAYIIKT